MLVPSAGGSRYILTFIDDYSRYTTVYLLKTKDEVLNKFKQFVALMENHSHQIKKLNIINCVRSDNGGEYKSELFKTFCEEKGISHQFTNPYSPQQNGVSERMNRTIVESARSLLYHAKLPLTFWAEAVNTAVYLRNRSPTSVRKGCTPFELWFDRKPDVSNLRVFGCICQVFIPDELRKKLEPKSYKAIFVGYPDDTKGYKVYNISSGKYSRSNNVWFSEGVFHDFSTSDVVDHNITFPEDTNENPQIENVNVNKETNEIVQIQNDLPDSDELNNADSVGASNAQHIGQVNSEDMNI